MAVNSLLPLQLVELSQYHMLWDPCSFLTLQGAGVVQEFTNYHFDVAPAALEGALDRFAQFFVAPLFQVGAMSQWYGCHQRVCFSRVIHSWSVNLMLADASLPNTADSQLPMSCKQLLRYCCPAWCCCRPVPWRERCKP